MQHLKPIHIRKEKYADYEIQDKSRISTLKKGCYCVVQGYSIMGDAPKSFIRVYQYQKGSTQRKSNRGSWPLYIAKTGHKWYPLESVTEHLIARIGVMLGLNMAESRLVEAGGQIKFLSKYFLKPEKGQDLVHGINIIVAYLGGDRPFVEEIAQQKREREFFTLEDTVEAISQFFPIERNAILEAQIKHSSPQMGLTGKPKTNHFELAEALLDDRFLPLKSKARKIFTDENLRRVQAMIRAEFDGLLSKNRINLICRCLEIRHQEFYKLLN